MYVLSGKLSEEHFAFGSRILRVVDGVNNYIDHLAYGSGILDVGVLVDDEEQIEEIKCYAQMVFKSRSAECDRKQR